jgi:predicted DNA-binding protein (MmcQ/YjbR family)
LTGRALERLREICLALPAATEKPFGGHTDPTWRVRDKIFVMLNRADHDSNGISLWCKAPPGAQDVLVNGDPERFFVPPYVGHNGWVGLRLDLPVDWELIAGLVTDSYRMTAPKRLLKQLETGAERLRPKETRADVER